MSYATIADLVAAATEGWTELAQRAAPDHRVGADVLQAVATGGDTSAWDADTLALAADAHARLLDALARASKHADTHLFPRYGAVLPLAPALVLGSSLPDAVAAIALKRLYGSSVPDELRRGTAWAEDYLMALAKGTASLGGADVQVAQPAGRTAARTRPGAFDWDRY